MKCSGCGKNMPSNPCENKEAGGIEGFVANNLPSQAWCSRECYEVDHENVRH